MTENLKESSKSQQKKNVFAKIKENIDDKDEQLAFISVVVRLVVDCLERIYRQPLTTYLSQDIVMNPRILHFQLQS